MKELNQKNYFAERIFWLIRLRWIAAFSVILTVYIANRVTNISLPAGLLYSVASFLIIYNLIFFFIANRFKRKLFRSSSLVNLLANIQISLDLLCLAILIHFSGGIENPFIFYFIFHMIIASILLTRRAAFLQATYAIALFLLICSLEYYKVLPHYSLQEVFLYQLYDQKLYILGVSFTFISTIYISVYMATSMSIQLREREKKLHEANKMLKDKDRTKSEYVLRVTHDIKEDLSAIHSCIDPVIGGIVGELNEGQKDLLTRAKRRSKQLIFYTNALLNITKLKLAKRLQMEPFSFLKLIDEILASTGKLADEKKVNFQSDLKFSTEEIIGVRVYIKETLLNLLANAIKYTLAGGKVILKVREKEDSFLVVIKDTGIGIPKDELKYVFDEFYRAKNARKQEKHGTGLGLSMAKQVIQMHKGRIWIESTEGKGTDIYLEILKNAGKL